MFLTTREVANMMGVDATSVNRWVDQNKISGCRTPGGHRRIHVDEFRRIIREWGWPIRPDIKQAPGS